MQRISSTGADLAERDITPGIEQTKVARVQSLFAGGLKAVGFIASTCVVAFLLVAGPGSQSRQAFENTVLIERLATRMAHADKISPETAVEISQLLRRRGYDCRRLACDAVLEQRNLAARNRLQAILTRSTLQADAFDR
jgi:hypothetical protein